MQEKDLGTATVVGISNSVDCRYLCVPDGTITTMTMNVCVCILLYVFLKLLIRLNRKIKVSLTVNMVGGVHL